MSAKASAPVMKNNCDVDWPALIKRCSVSVVYVGAGSCSSKLEAAKPLWSLTASSTIANRSEADATGADNRWGGTRAGTRSTRSSLNTRLAVSAMATCPLCAGSNVPPSKPVRSSVFILVLPEGSVDWYPIQFARALQVAVVVLRR